MVEIEPNYHVLLIAPAGPVEPVRHSHMLIPKITLTSTLLQAIIDRQGLDPELTWALVDMRYPEDGIDVITYPYLIAYNDYRPSFNDIDFELEVKEI